MYSIAKNIGLPATFVELRHQCTHEELPSLARLRDAAQRSLTWIWDHYWKTLGQSSTPGDIDECRTILYEHLTRWATIQSQETNQYKELAARLEKWPSAQIQEILMEIMESPTSEPQILLQVIRLSKEMLSRNGKEAILDLSTKEPVKEVKWRSLNDIQAELREAKRVLQEEEDNMIAPAWPTEKQQDVEMADNNEESDDDGWQMWKGPWIPKPIGVV
jgi:ribosomal biogenesis protein LAS1